MMQWDAGRAVQRSGQRGERAGPRGWRSALRRWLLAACLALPVGPALAQAAASAGAKLDGPLTVLVGYAPGGASDRIARLVAERLQQRLGVPVVVENKSGAGGRLAAQWMKGAGERNVLMLANPAVMVVAPLVYGKLEYAADDFRPVAMVCRYEFALAVPASAEVKDFAGLRSWLKAHPAQFNVGVPATGSLPHFFALMLGQALALEPQAVGYRGSGPLLTDLIGGVLGQAIDTLDTVLPQHQAGKVRVLAVSGAQRSASLPDVPTFREVGVDLVADGWNAFFAPASMPPERAAWLGKEIAAVMAAPDMQAQVRAINLEPLALDADATAQALAAYRRQWEPVVRASGFKAEQ